MKLSAKLLSAFLVSLTFTFLSIRSFAQVEILPKVYKVTADVTILEGRTSGNNELQIKNATRNIFGPLANQGEGVARFQTFVDTIMPIDDTTIRIYTSFEHDIFYDFIIRGAATAMGLQSVLNVSSNLLTDNQITLADGTSYKIYAGGPDDGIRTVTGHTHYGWWTETADTVDNISGSIDTYLGNAEMFAGSNHVFFTANLNTDSGFVYKEEDNGEGHSVPFRGIRYTNLNPADWTEASLVTKKYVDSILTGSARSFGIEDSIATSTRNFNLANNPFEYHNLNSFDFLNSSLQSLVSISRNGSQGRILISDTGAILNASYTPSQIDFYDGIAGQSYYFPRATGYIPISVNGHYADVYGNIVDTTSHLSAATTDDLAEGSTHKYFSNAQARSAISASGSITYNSTTGVISYTQPTNVSTYTNDADYISGTGTSGYIPYFSGTGTLSGSANHFWDNANSRLGLLTAAPTHSLTLGSTSTGIVNYNTIDQTTNYERSRLSYASNILELGTEFAGTGTTSRALRLGIVASAGSTIANGRNIFIQGAAPFISLNSGTTGITGVLNAVTGTYQASSTLSQTAFGIYPTINQSSTSGYTMLYISPFEQATGSGNRYLIDAGTNSGTGGSGTHTSKFVVDRGGNAFFAGVLGVGTGATISANIHSLSTTEQLRLGYDLSNYASFTVSSTGQLTISHQTSTKFNAKLIFDATNTASGTTGAQTINKPSGSVNFAAGAQTLVLTNSLITTSSHIICTIETDDATADGIKCVTVSSGSATIKLRAAATSETKVAFWVRD